MAWRRHRRRCRSTWGTQNVEGLVLKPQRQANFRERYRWQPWPARRDRRGYKGGAGSLAHSLMPWSARARLAERRSGSHAEASGPVSRQSACGRCRTRCMCGRCVPGPGCRPRTAWNWAAEFPAPLLITLSANGAAVDGTVRDDYGNPMPGRVVGRCRHRYSDFRDTRKRLWTNGTFVILRSGCRASNGFIRGTGLNPGLTKMWRGARSMR